MRRKFPAKKVDPNAPVVPPVPGSGAALPPRPKDLNAAAEQLGARLGIHVATGFGRASLPTGTVPAGVADDATWRLFAFCVDPGVAVPDAFMGFPVSRREAPTVSPAWGKAAHRQRRG